MRILMVIMSMIIFIAMLQNRSEGGPKGGLIEWIGLLVGLGCGISLVWEAFT